MLNLVLYKEVLDAIHHNRKLHDQSAWHFHESVGGFVFPFRRKIPFCETSHCFAGWAQILANRKKKRSHYWLPKRQRSIHKYAQELLGLDTTQSYYLFDVHRTRDDLISFYNTHNPTPYVIPETHTDDK